MILKLVHALVGAGGTGARTHLQEGPSRGPASSDQDMLDSCPTSSMVLGLVRSEDADQAD
ncbi:unnamed protein product [Prunus armeniaca]